MKNYQELMQVLVNGGKITHKDETQKWYVTFDNKGNLEFVGEGKPSTVREMSDIELHMSEFPNQYRIWIEPKKTVKLYLFAFRSPQTGCWYPSGKFYQSAESFLAAQGSPQLISDIKRLDHTMIEVEE